MSLEMRNTCETCESRLHTDSLGYICTHECTFCHECTVEMEYVCPNCKGELVQRPRSKSSMSCPLSPVK
ncbi:DUF1272 domain-containing protein [Paenibacillus illinoisensis]|uniref:DUF1272 domain-containing protein n=1 Tax=Paenibacillus illinoisensis TaxID=59845 RepID=A0ABW8HSI5_9BACL